MVLTLYSDHPSLFISLNTSFTLSAMHVLYICWISTPSPERVPPNPEKATKIIQLIENYKHNNWLL